MRDDIFINDKRGNKVLSLSRLIGTGYTQMPGSQIAKLDIGCFAEQDQQKNPIILWAVSLYSKYYQIHEETY